MREEGNKKEKLGLEFPPAAQRAREFHASHGDTQYGNWLQNPATGFILSPNVKLAGRGASETLWNIHPSIPRFGYNI